MVDTYYIVKILGKRYTYSLMKTLLILIIYDHLYIIGLQIMIATEQIIVATDSSRKLKKWACLYFLHQLSCLWVWLTAHIRSQGTFGAWLLTKQQNSTWKNWTSPTQVNTKLSACTYTVIFQLLHFQGKSHGWVISVLSHFTIFLFQGFPIIYWASRFWVAATYSIL